MKTDKTEKKMIMRRMTAMLIGLMLCVPLISQAAYTTPAGADKIFRESFYFYVPWQRTIYGSGMEASIYEDAVIDGHNYRFSVHGNGSYIAEISLYGWYPDLKMREAEFTTGLYAFNYVLWTLQDVMDPKVYEGLRDVLDAYDVYYLLKNGSYNGEKLTRYQGWNFMTMKKKMIEACHDDGAYFILSVDNNRFSFYCNPIR